MGPMISMESQLLPLATSASRSFAKSFETSSIQLANRRQLVVPSNPARRRPYRMLTLFLPVAKILEWPPFHETCGGWV